MRLLIALCLLAAPAFADGPSAPIVEDEPCDAPLVSWEAFQVSWVGDGAAEGYEMAQRLWEARCGALPVPMTWQERGWTDAELLAAVFNGHEVPDPVPAPVPLPMPGLLLAVALLSLWRFSRGR